MKTSSRRKFEQPLMEMYLRIKHPTLDPDTITETLGLEPEECIKVGTTASRSGVARLHSESYWIAGLAIPSFPEMARQMASSFGAMAAEAASTVEDIFPQLGPIELKNVLGATEYDMYILGWLRRLEDKRTFFDELNRAGGSATLLIQRNDPGAPLSLRRSLKKLDELGIGLEID